MTKYKIYLDDFCSEIFHEMEKIQDGGSTHIVEFEGEDKECCAITISEKLVPFLTEQLKDAES